MRLRATRWITRLLLGVMVFAQASLALADCPVNRGDLAHLFVTETAVVCESNMVSMSESGPQNANLCVAHCTADLQIQAMPVAIVRAASQAPVLLLPDPARAVFRQTGLESPAPGTPPPRILQHSYLI